MKSGAVTLGSAITTRIPLTPYSEIFLKTLDGTEFVLFLVKVIHTIPGRPIYMFE